MFNKIKSFFGEKQKIKNAFNEIYKKKVRLEDDSLSGQGSELKNTTLARECISTVLKEYNIKTFLDASCGDCTWIKLLFDEIADYTGLDVSSFIIDENKKTLCFPNVRFINDDSYSFLSSSNTKYNLILIRHTLEHLPTEYNLKLLTLLKEKCDYALITSALHDVENTNKTNSFGGYAPINLLKEPYSELLGGLEKIFDDYCISEGRGLTFLH